jgi:HTH-type transcriptional regulator/antitoxin HigA
MTSACRVVNRGFRLSWWSLQITTESVITRKPAEAFPPGEFIRDELNARGWTLADLAKIMRWPEPAVSRLIVKNSGITPELAWALAAAFGTSPQFWTNVDSIYRWHSPEI